MALTRPALAAPPLNPPPATPQPTAVATGETDPFTFTWDDGADGSISTDSMVATQIHDLLSGATYLILNNHQVQVGQVKNGQLTASFVLNEAHNTGGTYFVVHGLTRKTGTTTATGTITLLDGTIDRGTTDPTQGFAILTLVLMDDKGNVSTTHIEQILTFQKASP